MRKPLLLTGICIGRAVAITAFCWLPKSEVSASLFDSAMGLLWLSTVPLTNATAAVVFGLKCMSMLGGIVFFFHQIGLFLGGWLGGRLYVRTGSYDTVCWLAGGLSVAAALVNPPIREQPAP